MSNIGIVVKVYPGKDMEEVRKKLLDISRKSTNVNIPIRAGQRWSVEGVEMEIVDVIQEPWSEATEVVFRAPGTKCSTVTMDSESLAKGSAYVCGPTAPETNEEAVTRLLRLADDNVPTGTHPRVWSGLIAWCMEKLNAEWAQLGDRKPRPDQVRYYLTHLREMCEQTDRLRKHVR